MGVAASQPCDGTQEVDPSHQDHQTSRNVESTNTGLPYQPAAEEEVRVSEKVRKGKSNESLK